jgi:hypothetical protein
MVVHVTAVPLLPPLLEPPDDEPPLLEPPDDELPLPPPHDIGFVPEGSAPPDPLTQS